MKITGTKSYIQIEDDNGNIARFDGEVCFNDFYAWADSICWIKHQGEITDQDRIHLIYQVTQYGKDHDIKILFFDNDNKVMFEAELGLKTEVYWAKNDLIFIAVILLSMIFPIVFIAMLDVVSSMFLFALSVGAIIFVSPFILWGISICRFQMIAKGDDITMRPVIGTNYTFPVTEITRVERKVKNVYGWQECVKIVIYIKNKKITLRRSMIGFDDMDAYLLRHVDYII